jgi:hypothetical protein
MLNVAHLLTAVSLFFNITLKHTETFVPSWYEFKNSLAAEIALLHLQPLMNSHFHFLITVESISDL